MGRIWYLEHPTFRYEEDVKALAAAADLIIVDPDAAPGRPDEARVTPTVTLRADYRPALAPMPEVPQDSETAQLEPEAEPQAVASDDAPPAAKPRNVTKKASKAAATQPAKDKE